MLERGVEHCFEYSINPFVANDVNPERLGEVRHLSLPANVGTSGPAVSDLFSIKPDNISVSSLRVLDGGYVVTCYENSGSETEAEIVSSPMLLIVKAVEVDDLLRLMGDEQILSAGALKTDSDRSRFEVSCSNTEEY